jgi:prepilin-type N-terminal cleavage/methylation domain-containing protein/prepilin-type processing-associated H-X9-DG protein
MLIFGRAKQANAKSFTLIELLVVLGIIGILVSILVPTFGKAKRSALQMNCASNLKQIGLAVKMYLSDHDNVFPSLTNGANFGALATYYLPYLNGATTVFRCPAQRNYLPDIYGDRLVIPGQNDSAAWVGYEFNAFFTSTNESYNRTLTLRDVKNASICAYAYDFPYDPNISTNEPYIPHEGGMNVLYLDWHVNWLPRSDFGPLENDTADTFYNKGHLYPY